MDGFNLLPEEYQTRRGARFAPISMLATFGIMVLSLLLMERAVMVRAGKGSGSALVRTLAARRAELVTMRQDRGAVEKEIEPLAAVLSRTPVWSNVFVDVAGAIGQGVQFKHWGGDAERGLCTIEGRAKTNGEVFTLVSALEGLPHFESVTLAGVAKEKDGQGDGVHFEIVCRLRQAAQ